MLRGRAMLTTKMLPKKVEMAVHTNIWVFLCISSPVFFKDLDEEAICAHLCVCVCVCVCVCARAIDGTNAQHKQD